MSRRCLIAGALVGAFAWAPVSRSHPLSVPRFGLRGVSPALGDKV